MVMVTNLFFRFGPGKKEEDQLFEPMKRTISTLKVNQFLVYHSSLLNKANQCNIFYRDLVSILTNMTCLQMYYN